MFKRAPSSPTQKKGLYYESLALSYLERQGLELLVKNYHCRCGEIDLILEDAGTLVFTEVRYRENSRHGSALESIGYFKQRKLLKTASHFLISNGLYDKCPSRFDVIGVTITGGKPEYLWVRNAF